MEQSSNIAALSFELAQAVEVIMNCNTSQRSRMEAYAACERFKETSPLCAQVGLHLANGDQYGNNVKHFGLQLMEHTIKYKWNTISHQEKIFIKENAMKLLILGGFKVENINVSYMKDALTRIIVEMIKREWPQQWTTLLSELSDACSKGEAQTELVLMIFLRLVEDVALLQTIESNQRRKDIYQALTVKMDEIFYFFLRLIELHVTAFREATGVQNLHKANEHGRVVQVVLLTLTGFVEWVSINNIMCGEGKLLHILCILLNDSAFQTDAAECLSQIVSRKGQVKDRKPLLLLFSEAPLGCIFRASQLLPTADVTVEQNHTFLKKLNQVLTGLSQQLVVLWGKEGNADLQLGQSQQFSMFLETIYTMTRHLSLTIAHGAALIWNTLLKHEQITKDTLVLEYISKVIQVIGPKVIRIPYPTAKPIAVEQNANSYVCIEFDSEDEFIVFFHRARTDFLEIFRQSTIIAPLITFSYCEQWLKLMLAQFNSETPIPCSIYDPVYLEWEALAAVLDGVLSRILHVTERPTVASGLHLLEECLKTNTNDPLILSILLSCISALFVFLSMSSCQITTGNCVAMTSVSLLPRVLDKIFASLIYKINKSSSYQQDANTMNYHATKNLRRHAASLMVKLAHKYPLLLLPVFDQINNTVKDLIRQSHQTSNQIQLTKMEQVTLNEALVLISNHFCEYERQTNFVREVLHEAQSQWNSLTNILKTPVNFMQFIGLDKPPIQIIENDPNGANRGQIIDALHVVLGVLKRCTWPDDPDRAARGGFVIGFTESGNPICRNPATPHIIPLLPHILALLRILNKLYEPDAICMLSHGYKNAYAMLENEKKSLMGLLPVLQDHMDLVLMKNPSALDKMQQFLTTLFEGCYHMMGSAGPSLGRDLYHISGIADALINSTFASLNKLPDYRLRTIIRVFLKPFVYSCPSAFYDHVLLPVFKHLTPIMFNRLSTRWRYITTLYESGELNEEINDTQEVLEDMLNRSLTREYLEILKVALIGAPPTTHSNDRDGYEGCCDIAMDNDEQSMDGTSFGTAKATQSALTSDVISELGGKLLKNNITCIPILETILSSISWNDSACSLKGVYLFGPIIRYLITEQLATGAVASNALIAVLRGLQVHGQHEANQSSLITLGVQIYEVSRPNYPSILEIMQQIPNVNVSDLQKLDAKISAGSTKGNKIDKVKKDLFRKITYSLIGQSVNRLFRQEIQISNLPPTNDSRNEIIQQDFVGSTGDVGLSELFNPNGSII